MRPGKDLNPAQIRKLVTIIIDDCMECCTRPLKKDLEKVAAKLVRGYPSLKDVTESPHDEGQIMVIGTGSYD